MIEARYVKGNLCNVTCKEDNGFIHGMTEGDSGRSRMSPFLADSDEAENLIALKT